MADVFISYSRKDKAFAQRLDQALAERKRDAWVDWEGIPPTAEWLKEIYAGVEAASAFVMLCSPDSMASEVCGLELAHAVANNKRIIPLVCRDFDAKLAPPTLARLNWIFLRESDDFELGIGTLLSALDTDFDWVRQHTRVLVRAAEWHAKQHERSLLLRGVDLKAAEAWLVNAGRETRPDATALQREYLMASRTEATRRQRLQVGVLGALALVAVGFAIWALFNARQARIEAAAALARQLAAQSALVRADRVDLHPRAMLLAAEAMQRAPAPALEADQAVRALLALMPRHLAAVPTGGAQAENIVISKDGRFVAWALASGETRLWPVGSRAEDIRTWPGSGNVQVIGFDGAVQALLTITDRKTVRVRDIASGGLRHEITLPNLDAAAAALGNAAEHLAVLGSDGGVRVFDARGQPEGEFRVDVYNSRDPGVRIRFSPDNRLLAVGSHRALRICPVAQLQACATPAVEQQTHTSALEFSPDGQTLAVATSTQVRVYDVAGTLVKRFEPALRGAEVALSFSPDNSLLATHVATTTLVQLWDTRSGLEVAKLETGDTVAAVSFAADSKRIATSGKNGTSQVWRIEGRTRLALLSQDGRLGFVGDGSRIVTAGDGKVVHLWEAEAQADAGRLAEGLRKVELSADGRRVWAGHADKVSSWDLDTLRPLFSAEHTPPIDWPAILPELKRQQCGLRLSGCQAKVERLSVEGTVELLAVSPDGEFAATQRVDDVLRIWRVGSAQPLLSRPKAVLWGLSNRHAAIALMTRDQSGESDSDAALQVSIRALPDGAELVQLPAPTGLREFVFSPDGERALLVSRDYAVTMVALPSGNVLWQRPGVTSPRRVVFSGDGKLVAMTRAQPGSSDDALAVLNAADGKPVRDVIAMSGGIGALALSHDGSQFAVASFARDVVVRETRSGREIARAQHSEDAVELTFSHDQQLLATASQGTVHLIDLKQGKEIARIVPAEPTAKLRFTADDAMLATSSDTGVQLWRWRAPDLVAEACRRVPYPMSAQEWRLYLGNSAPQACAEAPARRP